MDAAHKRSLGINTNNLSRRPSLERVGKMNAYAANKALRHLDIVDGLKRGRSMRPAHVQLILTNKCNHRCSFCAYRDPEYTSNQRFDDRQEMSTEKALEIVRDCAAMDVSAIQLTGGGEPTVHPGFQEVVARIQRAGIAYAIVSNGALIESKGLVDEFAGAVWTRISIDAGRAKTYSKIRGVPEKTFDAVWKAVERVRGGVGFVVTPGNWKEIIECTRLARDAGANNIRIGAQFSSEGKALFEGFAEEAAALCREAEELADESFAVYNRFDEKMSDLETGRPEYKRCDYQRFTTYVAADLKVYRCCILAYNDLGRIASLEDRGFREAWLLQWKRGDRFDPSEFCERCQFNVINRTIGPVIDAEPLLHEEFV